MKNLLLNNKFIFALIILNAIVIFAMSYDPINDKAGIVLSVCDILLTFVFVAEIIVKILHNGVVAFFKSTWNVFDFVIVGTSFISVFLYFVDVKTADLSFVIVLRVARVFKTFRFIEFIPNINGLLKGIRRAFKASLLVLISLFVYNFILGIFSCHIYKNILPEYFGDPVTSIYSIFRIFTIEGWYEIPNAVAACTSPLAGLLSTLYFIIILLSGGILGISLVNSIFVDAMIADNNKNLEDKVDELNLRIEKLSRQIDETTKSQL